ncbi:hypothetical protein CPU12_03145 [Malaciobacter molluscorum LMG 25693]|uniref:Membrane protein n=2 Tax=Malaciobacter molluscorum LMG 25693 TaxID=870501 RepID=A0A2G1DK84_9BACT|nr:hypothetical protein [Malaciobacter molluscorum]AXX91381.1 putative membrane protein [Malaciobacter molluscorum LMG 25693]PHO18870.1 hypothetical protein CPU12_03145 [Malaciobacter molluscorum LMG 25693]RXJ94380.1 hypothetical protein CRV00_07360 [Malaciobacter molluscorum]
MKKFINYFLKNWNKILLVIFTLVALSLAFSLSIDETAKKLIDESFKQAVVVFGSAKALNAVVSLAQGTQLDLPFVIVSIGEVLDPINDLVEQFSLVMLASLTSLGIQKILLNFVTTDIYNYILTFFIIIFNFWLFKRFKKDEKIRYIFFKITVVLLFLRFAIPFISYVNDISYNYFVKSQYNIEILNKDIEKIKNEVSKVNQSTIKEKNDSSFFQKVKEKFDSSYYENKINEYKNAVNSSSEYIVDLIIVFIFQTIFLPILFLLSLYWFIKSIFSMRRL